MKKHILVCLAALACTALLTSAPVRAQSEASVGMSLLPVASVVGATSVGATAAGAVVALPAALSVGGAVLTCSVIGTGVVLSAAGEVLAFIPNALGRALLYNERVL